MRTVNFQSVLKGLRNVIVLPARAIQTIVDKTARAKERAKKESLLREVIAQEQQIQISDQIIELIWSTLTKEQQDELSRLHSHPSISCLLDNRID